MNRSAESYYADIRKVEGRLAKLAEEVERTDDVEASLSLQLKYDAAKSLLERLRRAFADAEALEEQQAKEQELRRLRAMLKDDSEEAALAGAMLEALTPLAKQVRPLVAALRAESPRIAELQDSRRATYRRLRELEKERGEGHTPEPMPVWPLRLAMKRLGEQEGVSTSGAVAALVAHLEQWWKDDSKEAQS